MKHISLASGASYFDSPASATAAAIQALQEGKSSYGPVQGVPALVEAIVKKYTDAGATIHTGHVLITPGVKQAIFNLFSILLTSENQEVLIPTPAWFGFHELMRYSKGKLVSLRTVPAQNFRLTAAALEAALTPATRILVLTNPGNPDGNVYTKQELESFLEVAAKYPDLYILSDEIYDYITYYKPVTNLLSCTGATERCIIVNGFSKSFAMPGWRIGYMIGNTDLITLCTDFQKSTLSGMNQIVQDGAVAALNNYRQELPAMLAVLNHNREFMAEKLQQIPHLSFSKPEGAYYFFPDLRAFLLCKTATDDLIETTLDLCDYLKEEYKLELLPGDYFGAPGFARMSFAIEFVNLQEALIRLQTALASLKA